ncbi:MAG: hypothetical protein IJV23_06855 [Prevotella sp.]|nr:hypothetical protein [Prevotella sp.]
MVVTLLVLNLVTSREVNDLQPLNMADMPVTLLVLNLVTSRDVNDLQL